MLAPSLASAVFMLSYQHAYHAGNHADILKHVVLLSALAQLTAKEKPLRYIETHAGAGGYDLRSPAAQKNREYLEGIGRLWTAGDAPAPVARLVDLVRRYNGGRERLERYPGSPWLARELLREDDALFLFELHPAEHRSLVQKLAADPRVRVLHANGLEGAIGLVPPPGRRGLVFVDPSYEIKDEPAQVLDALVKMHRRFATGTYAIWYPVIERRAVQRLEQAARRTGIGPIDLYELGVAPEARGRGLTGSGMLVANPPWKLREEMEAALPWLARTLGREERGLHRMARLDAPRAGRGAE
ncbi:MAG TPA: 23S rRNA (adenine(2030)-N(6))-methyltransferase RlmJ [Gammaproteobacteria bacterium]|nr:23S rRNA (adenine(2030)-N(6))-methyltransferase RlmJ [Gammaproteobacteria bacterium]